MGLERDKKTRHIPVVRMVIAALTGALYFVLTYFLAPIAFGPLQFRVGEAMTLLPLIFPESVFGLTIGCLIANIFSPYGWYDMVFGTLATLIAALGTYTIGRFWKTDKLWAKCLVGSLPPILINAFVLPAVWLLLGTQEVYWINVAFMLATQTGTIIPIGTAFVLGINKIPLKKLKNY